MVIAHYLHYVTLYSHHVYFYKPLLQNSSPHAISPTANKQQTNPASGRRNEQMLKMKAPKPLVKTLTFLYLSTRTPRGNRVETAGKLTGNDYHRELDAL